MQASKLMQKDGEKCNSSLQPKASFPFAVIAHGTALSETAKSQASSPCWFSTAVLEPRTTTWNRWKRWRIQVAVSSSMINSVGATLTIHTTHRCGQENSLVKSLARGEMDWH